jgi:23S rRNA pseudouridine1911/1915/1917 synthase
MKKEKLKETTLCSLVERGGLKDYLRNDLHFSLGQIKKHGPSPHDLHRPVKEKQEIELSLDLRNGKEINPRYEGPEISILFEDENLLAISKPPFIHNYPLKYSERDNCLSYLRSQYPKFAEINQVNSSDMERGLLYRLDFGTSGVLIFLKNEDLYHELRKTFALAVKRKVYLAIVCGNIEEKGRLSHHLRATGTKGHKMALCHEGDVSQEKSFFADCFYTKLDYSTEKDLSLIQVEIKTGVRHQIRAQFALNGNPLFGDELYGGKEGERLFLHAYHYEIKVEDQLYSIKDPEAELFGGFFDLNSSL